MKIAVTLVLMILYSFSGFAQSPHWEELGLTNPLNANGPIFSLCSDSSGNIYAVGEFKNTAGNNYVAKWNRSTNLWSELRGVDTLKATEGLYSILAGKENIYVLGLIKNDSNKYYIAKWDGATWSELGGPNSLAANNAINSMCIDSSGNLYVGGWFTNDSNKAYVAKWDKNTDTWNELGTIYSSGESYLIYTLHCDAAGNIYATGDFTDSLHHLYIAKWDGSSWGKLEGSTPLAEGGVTYITSDISGNLYAAGWLLNGSNRYYVAKKDKDSTTWNELGGVNALSANGYIRTIVTDKAGNVYATGDFGNMWESYYVAKYDGKSWDAVGGEGIMEANHLINSICIDPSGDVYAAGYFTNTQGKPYVAHFVTQTIGINPLDTSFAQATLYPNPARTEAKVSFEKDFTGNMTLVDMYGEIISEHYITNVTDYTLNIGGLAEGIFFVRLSERNGSYQVIKLQVMW